VALACGSERRLEGDKAAAVAALEAAAAKAAADAEAARAELQRRLDAAVADADEQRRAKEAREAELAALKRALEDTDKDASATKVGKGL
jgi:hypothetical protein